MAKVNIEEQLLDKVILTAREFPDKNEGEVIEIAKKRADRENNQQIVWGCFMPHRIIAGWSEDHEPIFKLVC